jgi:hypothetical protein
MSLLCALVLTVVGTAGDGLEEARSLLRRGLLHEAEQRLAPLLQDESDTMRRAHALLLMGNVDYERGHYSQARERYARAERDAAGEPTVAAAAAGNRVMAEQRLARGQAIADQASRLRTAVAATAGLAAVAIVWLGRQSRTSTTAGRR